MRCALVLGAAATLLSLAPPAAAKPTVIQGKPLDVVLHGGKAYTAVFRPGAGRFVLPEGGAAVRAPADASFFDVCDLGGVPTVVFVRPGGLYDAAGGPLLTSRSVFAAADGGGLFHTTLCTRDGRVLLLPTARGLLAKNVAGETQTLRFAQRPRAYSGVAQTSAHPARPYAAALSVYAPHITEADVNGDGAADVVLVHENRFATFLRTGDAWTAGAKGALLDKAVRGESDVRARVSRGPGPAVAFVVSKASAFAASSTVAVRSLTGGGSTVVAKLDGAASLIGMDPRRHAAIIARVDTSVMALTRGLVAGSVPVALLRVDQNGRQTALGEVSVAIDVRRGRLKGFLPAGVTANGQLDVLVANEDGAHFVQRERTVANGRTVLVHSVPGEGAAVVTRGRGGTKLWRAQPTPRRGRR